MNTRTTRVCKDCEPGVKRPAPFPGPRCATHNRDEKKRKKEAAWAAHIFKTYGLTAEQYYTILEHQEGVCFICRRAKGTTKKLAVDHDHATGYVRGLLCGPCNKVLGHFRDDDQAFQRGGFYLRQPPAIRWVGRIKPDE